MRFTVKLLCVILFTLLVGVLVYRYMPVKEGFNKRYDQDILNALMGITIICPIIFLVYMTLTNPIPERNSNRLSTTTTGQGQGQGQGQAQGVAYARGGGARK
jgi:multisubunit Na+/H+ antiporter MnhB subunit